MATAADNSVEPAERTPLEEGLDAAERETLGELDLVRRSLAAAVEAALDGDSATAERVVQRAGEADSRYADVHDRLLALVAGQAPVAGDLRLAVALLHVNDRAARMGAQCIDIATLRSVIHGGSLASDEQLECLQAMGRLADHQLAEAARSFAERDVEAALALREDDRAIDEHNRRCFTLAVTDGAGETRREAAFLVALMARAIERIGDNAVDIGQQTVFAATGRLRVEPPLQASGACA